MLDSEHSILRKCIHCGLKAKNEKDLDLFAKMKRGKFGRRNSCKQCYAKQAREYHKRKFEDQGLCGNCGKPNDRADVGGKYCSKCLTEYRKYNRRRHWDLRKKVIEFLGGRCVKCGIIDLRLLTINHREGRNMRTTVDSGHTRFYYRILSGKRKRDDLEIRCYNCNILYEFEQGYRTVPKGIKIEYKLDNCTTHNLKR